jgi:hypothetical protein
MYLFSFKKRTRLSTLLLSRRILSQGDKNLLQTTSTNTTYRTGLSEIVFLLLFLSGSSVRINAMVGISVEPLLDIGTVGRRVGSMQCCGPALVSMRIRIRIREFDERKL